MFSGPIETLQHDLNLAHITGGHQIGLKHRRQQLDALSPHRFQLSNAIAGSSAAADSSATACVCRVRYLFSGPLKQCRA
eukprot:9488106-Pyramimonas_sp.AAC.2